jgi:hypothetical protein
MKFLPHQFDSRHAKSDVPALELVLRTVAPRSKATNDTGQEYLKNLYIVGFALIQENIF